MLQEKHVPEIQIARKQEETSTLVVFVPPSYRIQAMNTRIQCPECGGGYLQEQMASLAGSRKGESFAIEMEALVCPKCGFKTVPQERAAEFALRTADAYREAHKLLTRTEIRDMRRRLGMTQVQFTKFLDVGEASVKRWELGEIQSPAMNRLMLLAVAEEERKRRHAYRPWGSFHPRATARRE